MDISILELRNTKALMVDREWLNGILPTAERILNGEIHTEKTEKRMQARVTMATSGNVFVIGERTSGVQRMADGGDPENHGTQVQNNEAYLNIIYIDGMITRNGGACTYGSKQIRNLMMQASDDEDCKGHVWVIDTPGGVANAVSDFKMAVDYAHERGLMVDGIIDGYCASLGIYAGEMCDHLYYTSPTDRIGSIGTFGIFDVMKNGDTDPTTGERHYEIYDPESYDKNAGWRELAEEGKTDIIVADLKKHGTEFRNFIKSRRPKAKDEMLHGRLYDCAEVDGILVDGQRTLQEVFQEVMAHYYQTHKDDQYDSARMQAGAAKENIFSPINNSINMKEKFPALFAALQVEEMQMQDGGAFMNEGLLATLNEKIEAMQKAEADAKALVESLTAEKNDLTAKVEELNADIEAKNLEVATLTENAGKADEQLKAKDEEIARLNAATEENAMTIAAKETCLGEMDKQIAELKEAAAQKEIDFKAKEDELAAAQTELEGAKASLTTAEQTLAERDQQITDLNAQITELQNNPGAEPAAGAAPQNNGGGADAPAAVVNRYVWNRELSAEENWKLEEQWNKEHGIEK